MRYTLYHSDCLDVLRTLPDCSIDAVVTDPPAGISFMNQEWDHHKGGRRQWVAWMTEVATECLRVLKPGGHALVWAIPRTSHWTGTAWEDAGFEVRDKIYHMFSQGFPKSTDVSKAIDRKAGATRKVVGTYVAPDGSKRDPKNRNKRDCYNGYTGESSFDITAPATPEAAQWDGWGTALKPAVEEWWLFRKPISESTVTENVLRWGTGAINIDGCRVKGEINTSTPYLYRGNNGNSMGAASERLRTNGSGTTHPQGRHPAHLVHDGSAEVVACFPVTMSGGPAKTRSRDGVFWKGKKPRADHPDTYNGGDHGSAARCFQSVPWSADDIEALRLVYCPKASRKDREMGCEAIEAKETGTYAQDEWSRNNMGGTPGVQRAPRHNHHNTVKPTALMCYLVRLVTPFGGVVLDPFMGSGSTGKAAMIEGMRFIGIEREDDYMEIARARIEAAVLPLFREPEGDEPSSAAPCATHASLFSEEV